MKNGDAKGRNQTDAQSANSTTNGNSQACAIDSGEHWHVQVSISISIQITTNRTPWAMKKEASNLLMQRSNDSKQSLEEEAVSGNSAILCPAIIDAIIPQPT